MDRFIIDNWTQEDYNSLILYLKSQADLKYRDFHSKLIPNCDKEYFIGIRVPVMRKLGKATLEVFSRFVEINITRKVCFMAL